MAAKKESHREVHYRSGSTHQRCSSCTMYVPTHPAVQNPEPHCKSVVDPIEPSGVCDIFKAKG